MESCTLRTSMQRVACFLVQSAPNDGTDTFDVVLQSSKQNLASHMSLAPETFSRVLSDLSEKKLIKVTGRTITVLDRQKLRSFIA
jgi:CRP-like cAMP-binding protein